MADGQPAEGQPAEGQPAEGQPADDQQAEGQPAGAESVLHLGQVLAAALESAIADWSEAAVVARGGKALAGAGRAAGEAATAALMPRLNELLLADINDQRGTPLSIVREAVAWPTAVLANFGVEPVARDPYDAEMFPNDLYGLSPATFSDLGEVVADAGLRWSVGKAFEHRRRHQRSDQAAEISREIKVRVAPRVSTNDPDFSAE